MTSEMVDRGPPINGEGGTSLVGEEGLLSSGISPGALCVLDTIC